MKVSVGNTMTLKFPVAKPIRDLCLEKLGRDGEFELNSINYTDSGKLNLELTSGESFYYVVK